MDQDSRSSESRERAISSEPCSTRPNPFDDGDLSARKRRRTSLSGSRSASIDTVPSQCATTIPSEIPSESNLMKVDTPEPVPPSTPVRPEPEPAAEPVSSKVTINLRNADSLEATPASPTSPTPAHFQKDDIKISVEESEVNMTPAPPAEEAPSSPSELDSPEAPNVSFEDIEDDLAFSGADPHVSLLADGRAAQFSAAMLDFPYHGDGETYYDTVSRLVNYFRQQPTHVDEVLHGVHRWLESYLAYADPNLYLLVMETFQENRPFWQALPDLFYTIAHRHAYSKSRETRDLICQLFIQVARLTSFLLAIDYRTLVQVSRTDDADFDLVSPPFLRFFGGLVLRDDSQLSNTNGYPNTNGSVYSESLDVFQASYGSSLNQLNGFAELLTSKLLRYPKKVMESVFGCSQLADSLVRDSYQKQLCPVNYSSPLVERSRKNLVLGLKHFTVVSNALEVVIDKCTNNLASDTATCLVNSLTSILKYSLHGNSAEATKLIQDHRQQNLGVIERFTYEAISFQWRLDVLCKMVRSRQMQLRVGAASMLCDDLVCQWKNYQGRQEIVEDTPYLEYLRYLSGYLASTGIVDYILGPTCHPEITQASFNIVGFLAVTKTYTAAQTELFWQTLTSTQDPRISDALVRMMSKVIVLLDLDSLSYICEKFHSVSIDSFSACMRELFEHVTKQMQEKVLPYQLVPLAPYKICVRLLQESSIYGPQGSIAYPEIHQFILARFTNLLQIGPNPAGRQTIWMACVQDIAAKSNTTSGSLEVISSIMGSAPGMQILISEHDLTRRLVDELESTIAYAQAVGFAPVYAHPISMARRKIISNIILCHGATIDSDLGRRLWDLLVGNGAACQDDRKVAWEDLNLALKRTRLENPFINACLREYLPRLPPSCYCAGSLAFIREAIVPLVNDLNSVTSVTLDDEDSLKSAGLELLWQMILTAPSHTIEDDAIFTLVSDIYVDSKSIMSYPLHRARRVHFALVQRCLQQLRNAAQRLKAFSDGTASGDDEPMVIVATDDQHIEQELQFTRSLQVLITLLRTLQNRPHFAAPDLRSLMLQTPSPVDGDPADLKYQSFDGDQQSEVKPLDIGLKNTAASLLASLREATGFDNYRLYHRGQPLAPSDTDICKSIEDLDIKSGLILVKRELGVASSPVRIKPGASPLDIEILGHFQDLWDCLSMEENLAREIYHFLISLPADDSILAVFDDSSASYKDIFPLGQPFKSLYAIHALREYLSTRRLKSSVMQTSSLDVESQQQTSDDQREALVRAMSLIVAAICDPDVVGQCSSEAMQIQLSLQLVDGFVQLLKETVKIGAVKRFLTPDLSKRLLVILASAAAAQTSNDSIDLITWSFEALLESCTRNKEFWTTFYDQIQIQEVIENLLFDPRQIVRRSITRLIADKSLHGKGTSGIQFAELFWPIVLRLVPRAAAEPAKCEELFLLTIQLLARLNEAKSSIVDLPSSLRQWGELLLSHKSTEDISLPADKDSVAHGLITILHIGIKEVYAKKGEFQFASDFPERLFSRHLFPPDDERGPLVPQVILHPASRTMLCDIIFALAKDDVVRSTRLLQNLDTLTSYRDDAGIESYMYELPQLFERTNAIRTPCGYSGLRNLSNTCYLNSLFTQLFMNVGFRSFMLNTRVRNPETHQLLQETQMLFAFLQDSRRRFVEPQACVSQIMTYDEAPIDIHNQMDVDEFYNLLFDRWEAQLPSEREKKALRSIYGGELVQQVKSNECEHISERIEPFSAIQCDIKGKASLEESLQAYVDGEIMEGDNKYKCSDCDRHVDAVKRACLKDIPNNLIFHLKRFDFNLRTLTRSKINDYFPFPSKIDMQPYTIEHLSDPSRNTEPDIFELVGVLVHSGTAESGHYYSFIRERPSANNSASWVEFNDEIVGPWDPSQMENACFGGPEYRSHFEAGTTYEKVFSAYMLFYQRSSSLEKEQDMLKSLPSQSGPFRCRLPPDLELQVKEDNWSTVQRHCLYDPNHVPFVIQALDYVWAITCSDDHKRENLAMSIALGHLDQVASRAKDLPHFDRLKDSVMKACQRCSLCCYAFFDYFKRHREALRMLLQRNSDHLVRQDMGRALIFVLSSLKVAYPEEYGELPMGEGDTDIVETTLDMFLYVWETFHTRLNSWPEYFGTMVDFARLGRYETMMFLEKDLLLKLIMVITADPAFDLPPQYARLLNAVSRRLARPPSYDAIIALVDALLSVIDPELENARLSEQAEGRLLYVTPEDTVPFTVHEVNILHKDWARGQANIFVDKLIQLNQNPVATDSIISRLMGMSSALDLRILSTVRLGISGELVAHMVSPYLRVAVTYCRSSVKCDNVHRLINDVSNHCRNLQNAEGRSFFEFQRDIYEGTRSTDETSEMIQLHSLENLPRWVPGLLGYIDHTVSDDVDSFVQEKLFRHGPSPVFDKDNGGIERSQAMNSAARHLGISCLEYLRDTYVLRATQAARDTVVPLDRVIKKCEVYFRLEIDDGLDTEFHELCQAVLEPMDRLTVDEIEEEGSGMWSDSTTATMDYD
ncbi:hypothetical protein F5B20DRAFT_429744 [Whalleya microplaca]|nr:hypothetical protein F5B20DRAFT_429744 [Whalleya microplaca]